MRKAQSEEQLLETAMVADTMAKAQMQITPWFAKSSE
jgi:hypothetical protein